MNNNSPETPLKVPPKSPRRTATKADLNGMMPLIYDELHRIAEVYMSREREGHTLQPTALINEAYMRLLTQHSVDFNNRSHVLGVAAQMMRRILCTHEEKRRAEKRGGDYTMVTLNTAQLSDGGQPLFFSEVDEVLDSLARIDARQAQVAELRILGGMTVDEIADFLAVSPSTVHRDWVSGRLWLARELRENSRNSGAAQDAGISLQTSRLRQ